MDRTAPSNGSGWSHLSCSPRPTANDRLIDIVSNAKRANQRLSGLTLSWKFISPVRVICVRGGPRDGRGKGAAVIPYPPGKRTDADSRTFLCAPIFR
jgi:hypothetical protein